MGDCNGTSTLLRFVSHNVCGELGLDVNPRRMREGYSS